MVPDRAKLYESVRTIETLIDDNWSRRKALDDEQRALARRKADMDFIESQHKHRGISYSESRLYLETTELQKQVRDLQAALHASNEKVSACQASCSDMETRNEGLERIVSLLSQKRNTTLELAGENMYCQVECSYVL